MENKVRFKLHKVKKHWITIAASSLAIGASLISLGQVGADEVKPETVSYTHLKEREHPGFETIDGKLYYFTDSARMLHDEFVEENGQTYYLGSDGVEVAGWLRSLQLRGINLPDALKDEAFLIIGERRTH